MVRPAALFSFFRSDDWDEQVEKWLEYKASKTACRYITYLMALTWQVGLPALPLPASPIVDAHGNGQKVRGLAQAHTQANVCSDTPRTFTMASETASMAPASSARVRA